MCAPWIFWQLGMRFPNREGLMARPGKSRAQKPDKVGCFARQGLSCKTKRLSWLPFPSLSPSQLPPSLPPHTFAIFPITAALRIPVNSEEVARQLAFFPNPRLSDRQGKPREGHRSLLFPSLGGCGRPPGGCQRGGETAAYWREKGTGPAGTPGECNQGTHGLVGEAKDTQGHTHTHTHTLARSD